MRNLQAQMCRCGMILVSAKKILVEFNLVGAINLVNFSNFDCHKKKSSPNFSCRRTVEAGANDFGGREKDL